ncbi:MAG: hypothetical protein IJ435_05560 [Clostridia bacterium]|nr:hypothetical protein [Clostridia bacterium]
MKKFIVLIGVIMSLLLTMVMTAIADEIPTAKVTATLVGNVIPVAGEKFTIAINISDISSALFVSGEVLLDWSEEAVSLVDYYEDEPVTVTNNYCIGNIYNEYAGRTGKFTYISNFDDAEEGHAAIAIYIPPSARKQDAESISDFTMFEMSFMLNEGFIYDDFYLNIVDSDAFLTADKQTVSSYRDGKIELEGIGEAENNNDNYTTVSNGYLLMTLAQMNVTNTDLSVNINMLYNNEYNEAVLIKNKQFTADILITNTGSENKEVICYIAEYNSDNTLIGFTKSNTITVSPESMVTENLEHDFTNDAVKAKVFCWKNGVLMPIGKDIVLTAEATDYYADTYADSNFVDINKQICGEINVDNDVDIVKIVATEAGKYVVKFSADNIAGYVLLDSANNALNATAVDNNCAMYNLQGNSTYYLKMTGSENNTYRIKPMLAENVIKNIAEEGLLNDTYDCELYEFTPETTGEYIITAVGTNGAKASLYNSSFQKLAASETGDTNVSFRITCDMITNEKYYIAVEQKNDEVTPASYELYVEEPFEIVSIY